MTRSCRSETAGRRKIKKKTCRNQFTARGQVFRALNRLLALSTNCLTSSNKTITVDTWTQISLFLTKPVLHSKHQVLPKIWKNYKRTSQVLQCSIKKCKGWKQSRRAKRDNQRYQRSTICWLRSPSRQSYKGN